MAEAVAQTTPQDAIIYLMVMASASDGQIEQSELMAIGRVVRSFPLFSDEDEQDLVTTSENAGTLMSSDGGLHKVIETARVSIPSHLAETAYAAVVDVVTADETLKMEEIRILELIRQALSIDDEGAAAIEHAARARHMTLEDSE